MRGVPFDENKLGALSDTERRGVAESFGRTVALLQREATTIADRNWQPLDDRCTALLVGLRDASPRDRTLCDSLLTEIDAIPADHRAAFVHGDAHLSNLLVDDSNRVCGLVDFAEAGRGFREIDLAYLHWLPAIAETARAAYQVAAARQIDERAYCLAGAVYALTSAVLGERAGTTADAAQNRALLRRCVDAIGPARR